MVKHCIAYGCTNRSSKPECKHLSWHSLPLKHKKLLADWLVKLRRENTPVTKNSYVCSEHFDKDCFIKPLGGQRMHLRQGSVPTKFAFTVEKTKRKMPCYTRTSKTDTNKHSNRTKTTVARDLNIEFNEENNEDNLQENIEEPMIDELLENIETEDEVVSLMQTLKTTQDKLTRLEQEWTAKENELNSKIKELEEQLTEERNVRKEFEMLASRGAFSIETVKSNDKLLKFYTSFDNYEVFTMVLDFLGRETAANLDYLNTPKMSTKTYRYKPGPSRTLTVENEFFMVLCRLKVGLLEEDIATRFGVNQSVVSTIINTWIKFMYYRFKELDIFPSRDIIKLHMPESFKRKYPTTTLIIDATEIYIEKPNNPEAQQLTFSSYKNTNTLKALVGIVPKGSISFVSTLYGGSISDKELTARSGLIEKLQRDDVLMADRGFNISDLLVNKGVKVNVPPFMNQSGQFNESELLETRRIATLRIHVERAMERIKNYHILDFIPITLCRNGIIDMIFFVCAMLSNFQLPLVDG